MALVDPRRYSWEIDPNWPNNPFVVREQLGDPNDPRSGRTALTAGDGHRIPFPLCVFCSEYYWRRRNCRVLLMVEDGVSPQYPGINYVMEINLSGNRELSDEIRPYLRRIPRTPQFGPVGQVAMSMFIPSDLASEQHWAESVRFWQSSAVVRYDYLP
jgi:hypothetical protein